MMSMLALFCRFGEVSCNLFSEPTMLFVFSKTFRKNNLKKHTKTVKIFISNGQMY